MRMFRRANSRRDWWISVVAILIAFWRPSLAFLPDISTAFQGGIQRASFLAASLSSSSSSTTLGGPLTPLKDDFDVIRYYTELAITHRGAPKGLDALRILATKCQQREPYLFDDDVGIPMEASPAPAPAPTLQQRPGSVVASVRQLIPANVTRAFLQQVYDMEAQGWISTNPDSVDGLPSLHLNLVSHGRPLFPTTKDAAGDDEPKLDDYQRGIQKLLGLVEGPIYDTLLPRVHKLFNTTSIKVSDIFLRRYGQDICGKLSRNGISAHYDVFSRVTSVIALDDVAAEGRNGLFTTYLSPQSKTITSPPRLATSNHAAMRRFFPLKSGDGVVHTWDILHGVDVEPGLDRTSLIIWFTQEEEDEEEEGTDNESKRFVISPWLLQQDPNHQGSSIKSKSDGNADDDVAQFVLASALSSVAESGLDPHHLQQLQDYPSENELYLESARQGNTFALTRMGTLLEEAEDDTIILSEAFVMEAEVVLEEIRNPSSLPDPLHHESTIVYHNVAEAHRMALAKRFWYEGAVRGNPLAQRALGDEWMLEASQTGDADVRLAAAVLFALAAQQGVYEASDSLARVVEYDLASRDGGDGGAQDEESFLASPVVQTARAAMSNP